LSVIITVERLEIFSIKIYSNSHYYAKHSLELLYLNSRLHFNRNCVHTPSVLHIIEQDLAVALSSQGRHLSKNQARAVFWEKILSTRNHQPSLSHYVQVLYAPTSSKRKS